MTFRPSVIVHPRVGFLRPAWLLVAVLLFLVAANPLSAQEQEGTWRLVVRHDVPRGDAERAIQGLQGLPGLELIALPNGNFAVHVGRYPNEDEAQRELERYLSQEGRRLGAVGFIPSATPTPVSPSPTPAPTPSPTATAAPVTPPVGPPDPAAGLTEPSFSPPPAGGGGLPWPLIIAVAAGVVLIGGGLYYFVLRKKEEPAPPPAAVKPMAPPPPRPKSAAIVKPPKAEPKPEQPKPAPAPEEPEAPPAPIVAPVAIRIQSSENDQPPVAARAPIAMPEAPQMDPTPSIVLNDIFADEPDTPSHSTPLVDEGPRLDFLLDDEPKKASGAGNGSSGTGDEGLGIPLNFGGGAALTAGGASELPLPKAFPVGAGVVLFEQDLTGATPGQAAPGWSGSYDYAKLTVATEENGSGVPHLRFEKESGIGSAYFSCQFPEAHGRLAVDFEIRCDDKNKYLLGFYIEKDQDFRQSIHALIHRTNAKANPVLRLQNESVPYDFGTWRQMRYEIDLVRHLIDGFVDGVPVIVGQRVTSCPDGLNTLSIRDNLATTGVLLLRGIKITSLD